MWIPVKHFLNVLLRALRRARHFALVEGSAIPTKGPLVIVSGLKLSSTHASLRSLTAIMITTSNSSLKRSGMPNQLLGVLLHTIAMSGLSRVRTELLQLLVIPLLAHHPVKANRQFARQGHL